MNTESNKSNSLTSLFTKRNRWCILVINKTRQGYVRKYILKRAGYLFLGGGVMSKIPFTKPATTHEEQVSILQQRGMEFSDTKKASFYLQHINYYRLGAF